MYESFLSNCGKTVDQSPTGVNDFTLSHSVQIAWGSPSLMSYGFGTTSPAIKRPEHKTDHSYSSSVEVMNA
jgi:hypothetical protein